MWIKHGHKIAPLTKLCSTKIKFKWMHVENDAFVAIKNIVVCAVLLSYPKFSEKFIIQTDTSNTLLGGLIFKNIKPISFYSPKLTPAQIN